MKPKSLLGIALALIGFLLPFAVEFSGLSPSGHIALSLFLMAAALWMFEPIPIYATSLLVILLGILLLSREGPVFSSTSLPTTSPVSAGGNLWHLPARSITVSNEVIVVDESGRQAATAVQVVRTGDPAVVSSERLSATSTIVADVRNIRAGYSPNAYTDYLSTLAHPVIILFLGGLLLAEASVKYDLDKNISRIVLKPFGTKPGAVLFGLMAVTGGLSAFMSNTAATAMMMTVVLPIVARMPPDDRFRRGLLLAIPVGANLGGIATPIGTPPNAVALAGLAKEGIHIPFGVWVIIAAPIVMVMIGIVWKLLMHLYPPSVERLELMLHGSFNRSRRARILYVIAGLAVVLWVTESLHGVSSSIVAFGVVAALAVTGVVDHTDIRKIPWEVLWLVAGGIALDVAMRSTGLAGWFVASIGWEELGNIGIVVVFGAVGIVLSQFLSNTITATLLMPIAISVGASRSADEPLEMIFTAIVVGIGVSFAMALPISTPPNAIAAGTGLVNTRDMARVGIVVAAIGLVVLIVFAEWYLRLVLPLFSL